MKFVFISIAMLFVSMQSFGQHKGDYYITHSQDTVYGKIGRKKSRSFKFTPIGTKKSTKIGANDFKKAYRFSKGLTYLSAIKEGAKPDACLKIYESTSTGPIFLIENINYGGAPMAGGFGFSGGGWTQSIMFLIKEGTNQLIYVNSTGLFGSAGKEKINKLKAILSDDEMSVATLESGIKRRLSVTELRRVIQEYNARNYNRK